MCEPAIASLRIPQGAPMVRQRVAKPPHPGPDSHLGLERGPWRDLQGAAAAAAGHHTDQGVGGGHQAEGGAGRGPVLAAHATHGWGAGRSGGQLVARVPSAGCGVEAVSGHAYAAQVADVTRGVRRGAGGAVQNAAAGERRER